MKVMEIVSGDGVNGAIAHCLLLSRELARRGHQLTLVCRPGAWIAQQLAAEPIEIVPSDLHRWPTDEVRRIAELCRTRQIEVLHTHMSRAHFFGVLLRFATGVPCVASAHSRHVQLHWMFNDRVIANSEATRFFHRWCNLVPGRRIDTIHCFIDHERLTSIAPDARCRIRRELGVGDDCLLIGQVGDLVRRKGLIFLVRALPAILKAIPTVRLVVAGSGGMAHPHQYGFQVRREAERLGVADRIHWLGRRSDVPELLAALDVFVLASLAEAQGLAPLEAMAEGVPVVVTSAGGLREMVVPEENGLMVPPGDSQALAAALIRLLNHPQERQALGAAGRDWVRRHFSPESQVPQVEAVLARCAALRRAA